MKKKKSNKEKGQSVSGRALRGGSWNNQSDNLRCAARNNDNPRNNWNNNGFRVVLLFVPNHTYQVPIVDLGSEPDAGILRNTGLLFGYDIRPFFLRSCFTR